MGKLIKQNLSFIVLITSMLIFRSAIADWSDVPTGSMQPTIKEGDRIWVNKMAYDLRVPFTHISLIQTGQPKRGDIVIFDSKVSDKRLVKRVVGLPGDRVAMKQHQLFINDQAIALSEMQMADDHLVVKEKMAGHQYNIRLEQANTLSASFAEVEVPANHYLVLGDNRDNSADSRMIGFVPR
ncbi:signal peptidase I, partial [Catenovulum sp. SM1970]|uniref:signal peptidase I n=1 Tax=Marinifaba aquimaris TaxID=2741323 RepID=UPI001573ECDB